MIKEEYVIRVDLQWLVSGKTSDRKFDIRKLTYDRIRRETGARCFSNGTKFRAIIVASPRFHIAQTFSS